MKFKEMLTKDEQNKKTNNKTGCTWWSTLQNWSFFFY